MMALRAIVIRNIPPLFRFLFWSALPDRGEREEGQALAEMLISLAILMLVLMGIVSATTFGMSVVSETSFKGQSIHIAQEGIERARVQRDQGWSGIVDDCCGSNGLIAPGSSFSRTIQVTDISPDEKQIRIDVSWMSRGKQQKTTLVTVLTNL